MPHVIDFIVGQLCGDLDELWAEVGSKHSRFMAKVSRSVSVTAKVSARQPATSSSPMQHATVNAGPETISRR